MWSRGDLLAGRRWPLTMGAVSISALVVEQ
jgi:hypothetical protein